LIKEKKTPYFKRYGACWTAHRFWTSGFKLFGR